MKYEVRCCCNPDKLVGWLEMPEREKGIFELPILGRVDVVRLEMDVIGRCMLETIQQYPAVKAGHIPREILKRLPGFTENSEWAKEEKIK